MTYALFGVALIGALAAWWRSRSRNALIAVGGTAALLLTLVALDTLLESPREQAVSAIKQMGQAANRRDWTDVGSHIAETFRYNSLTKAAFLEKASASAGAYDATVNFTAFDREQAVALPNGGVRIGFVGQISSPQATNRLLVYVEASFAPAPDGQQKMVNLTFFNYIQRQTELRLPGV